jgi:hypothetical protein
MDKQVSQKKRETNVVKVELIKIRTHAALRKAQEKMVSKQGDIPFLLPVFMKKTQSAELRLPLTAYKITLTNATNYTTVLALSASAYNNFTDCANLFDEYRAIRGLLQYHPTYANTATNVAWGGAAVDYSVSGAFGSFDAMYSHDQSVIGNYTNYNSRESGKARFSWPVLLEKLPDEDWIPTTTNSTVFAYWKPFLLAATITATEDAGHLLGWMDFQFRGMAA